jgi:hypothetical protein
VLAFLISQHDTAADPRRVPVVLEVELKATSELVGHVGLSALGDSVEIGFAIDHFTNSAATSTQAPRPYVPELRRIPPTKESWIAPGGEPQSGAGRAGAKAPSTTGVHYGAL